MKNKTLVMLIFVLALSFSLTYAADEIINDNCPVMGTRIRKDTPFRAAHKGDLVGFCCAECVRTFKTNPEKYLLRIKSTTVSGELKDGVRVVEVKAFRYGYTPDPIVVKKLERVRIELTSTDVTHTLYFPVMGREVTAAPGQTKTMEFFAEAKAVLMGHCRADCGPGCDQMNVLLKIIE